MKRIMTVVILLCVISIFCGATETRESAALRLYKNAVQCFHDGLYGKAALMAGEAHSIHTETYFQGRCLALQGEALLLLGRPEALSVIYSALEQLEGSGEPLLSARLFFILAGAHKAAKDGEEAETAFIRGLLVLREHLGTLHPRTAIHLLKAAQSYRQETQYYLAERCLHEALRIAITHFKQGHRLFDAIVQQYRMLLAEVSGTVFHGQFMQRLRQIYPAYRS